VERDIQRIHALLCAVPHIFMRNARVAVPVAVSVAVPVAVPVAVSVAVPVAVHYLQYHISSCATPSVSPPSRQYLYFCTSKASSKLSNPPAVLFLRPAVLLRASIRNFCTSKASKLVKQVQ
jgi:hypothetical protein